MVTVIAYTYEADVHCVPCATSRFVAEPGDLVTGSHISPEARDSEGNPVHPVFSTDENPDGLTCGDCLTVISEPWWVAASSSLPLPEEPHRGTVVAVLS